MNASQLALMKPSLVVPSTVHTSEKSLEYRLRRLFSAKSQDKNAETIKFILCGANTAMLLLIMFGLC